MSTTGEAMLNALRDRLLAGVEAATVKRNVDVPQSIDGRLIIIRDGEADLEEQLGTDGPWYVSHRPQVELYVQAGTPEGRDAGFAALAAEVDAVLTADLTLGGLVFGMAWDPPQIDTDRFPGAAGIKAAVLEPTVEYQSDTRL